jgi:hypothetical protein
VLPHLPRALALALAAPLAARAASPGDPIRAVRLSDGRIAVDGRLVEPAWSSAPVHDGFVQLFPRAGAPPSEPTEVRVLYDDHSLYVGVLCRDRSPELVQRPLGRRDSAPYSDAITVAIDSMHEARNAFLFSLTAAGVQSDGLMSGDDDYNGEWDATWDGATSAVSGGWSAELVIPLSALRFPARPEQVFGFGVKRVVGRTHEEDFTALVPRGARGQLARLGSLVGLSGLVPVRELELSPYTAGRISIRPQYDDADRPQPRLVDPYAELGLDLRTTLGPGLSLQGALNPDFGQVEADQLIQNLSTFEVLFPEKRPFFTQGMDLFLPIAPQGGQSPQQLLYSRRIGLSAPILGAVKLTGRASDQVQIGVVEALVAGAGSGRPEEDPARRYRFDPAQPLRFGPASALPRFAPAPENYLAGVVRWRPLPTLSLGATATSTLLLGRRCTPEEDALDDDERPPRCDALAGNAAALDLDLRTRDGEWFVRGQVSGSQALGGAPERALADGTRLSRGELGFGAHAAAGRAGGEPWRFEVNWEYESPELELNPAGYQRTQNEQVLRAIARYVRPGGGGPFHSYALHAGAEARYTTDGRGLLRAGHLWAASELQLRSFHWVGWNAWGNLARWDVREVEEAGVAYRRPADAGGALWISSDPSRPLRIAGSVEAGSTIATGPLLAAPFASVGGTIVLRPHPRLESRIDLQYERNRWPARWVLDDGEGSYLFADLSAPLFSATLRQQVVLARHLTLQGYAQVFTSYGRYTRYREAQARSGRVALSDLHPPSHPLAAYADWENPDFRDGALNVTVVLRWEYRLGSTLFLVYSRSQAELGYPDQPLDPSPPATLRPSRLEEGPSTDTLLVKWTLRWRR